MSLIAHYPLNGDTLDYSGNNNHLIYMNNNNKLVVDNSGKIGKCYKRNVVNDIDGFRSTNKVLLNESFTFSCWAFVTETVGVTANGLVTNHNGTLYSGSGITVREISTTDYRICCNTGDGTNRTCMSYYGTTNIKNVWSHLIVKYDKPSKTLSLWVNGIKENEVVYNMYCVEDYLGVFCWVTNGIAGNAYKPACKLNDVRIYNHALSLKEIKDVYRTKVLHYKFNDIYEEPTENLFVNKNDITKWLSNQKSEITKEKINDIDYIKCKSLKTDSTPGMYQEYTLEPNTTYTFSCKLQCNDNTKLLLAITDITRTIDIAKTARIPIINETQFNISFTTANIANNGYSLCILFSTPTLETFMLVRDVQLEQKDHFTPFTETSRLFNIIDSSGFRNHGLVQPRRAPEFSNELGGSLKFDGSKYIKSNKIFTDDINQCHSVSAWVKLISNNDSNQALINFNKEYKFVHSRSDGKSIMYINDNTNGYDNYVYGSPIPLNTWTMVTWVLDTSKQRSEVYYNGKLEAISFMYDVTDIPYGFDIETIFGNNFIGSLKDITIYATALSAEEIWDLYNARIKIDNTNQIHCDEFIESTNLWNETLIYNKAIAVGAPINLNDKIDNINSMSLNPRMLHTNTVDLVTGFKPTSKYIFNFNIKSLTTPEHPHLSSGIRIHYTDNSVDEITSGLSNGLGIWKKTLIVTNKPILAVRILYANDTLTYFSHDCSITEVTNNSFNINTGKIENINLIEEVVPNVKLFKSGELKATQFNENSI